MIKPNGKIIKILDLAIAQIGVQQLSLIEPSNSDN